MDQFLQLVKEQERRGATPQPVDCYEETMSHQQSGNVLRLLLSRIASNYLGTLTLYPEPVQVERVSLDERMAHSWRRVGDAIHAAMKTEQEKHGWPSHDDEEETIEVSPVDAIISTSPLASSRGAPSCHITGRPHVGGIFLGGFPSHVLRANPSRFSVGGIRETAARNRRQDHFLVGRLVTAPAGCRERSLEDQG